MNHASDASTPAAVHDDGASSIQVATANETAAVERAFTKKAAVVPTAVADAAARKAHVSGLKKGAKKLAAAKERHAVELAEREEAYTIQLAEAEFASAIQARAHAARIAAALEKKAADLADRHAVEVDASDKAFGIRLAEAAANASRIGMSFVADSKRLELVRILGAAAAAAAAAFVVVMVLDCAGGLWYGSRDAHHHDVSHVVVAAQAPSAVLPFPQCMPSERDEARRLEGLALETDGALARLATPRGADALLFLRLTHLLPLRKAAVGRYGTDWKARVNDVVRAEAAMRCHASLAPADPGAADEPGATLAPRMAMHAA